MNNNSFNLKEKDIYKLFNNIKIEENEFDNIKDEIQPLQKERIKKKLKRKIQQRRGIKIFKYGSAAAAIGLACIIGAGIASPTFAQNVPVLNSIIQALNSKQGVHGDYAKYSQIIGKSVTSKGITVTIDEVIADDSKLIIGYTVKSDKKISNKDSNIMGLDILLKVNGKTSLSSYGSSMGNFIDDNTYVGSEEIHTDLPQTPQNINVDLNICEALNTKGKWNFAFTASKEELSQKTAVFKPIQKIDLPNSNVTIDKVAFSPIGTCISLSGSSKDTSKLSSSHGLLDYDYWIAFDDKGTELIPNGLGGGTSNLKKNVFSSEMNYEKVDNIPKYLTIVPCKIIPQGGGGAAMDKDGKETPLTVETKKPEEISKIIDGKYPIELSQGKMGKLIIKEIKTENNKTTVKFTGEGKAPYFQASSLYIKDESGKDLIPQGSVQRNAEKPNEFMLTLEAMKPDKKYTIYTDDFSNVDFGENLKFKINLR